MPWSLGRDALDGATPVASPRCDSGGKMAGTKIDRRAGLLLAGGAAGAASTSASAQLPARARAGAAPPPAPAGYLFLKPAEAAFVEAVVNHMIPADELTANGVDLGVATF